MGGGDEGRKCIGGFRDKSLPIVHPNKRKDFFLVSDGLPVADLRLNHEPKTWPPKQLGPAVLKRRCTLYAQIMQLCQIFEVSFLLAHSNG